MIDTTDLSALTPDQRRALLAGRLRRRSSATRTEVSNFERYVNPNLGSLLRAARLDRTFVRGEECMIWDAEGRGYLDFTAAFGALPFGYNPKEIWAAIQRVRDTLEPSFTQPSAQAAAGELARRLLSAASNAFDTVTFANSGAEAIEAAIKMARSAKRRRLIVSTLQGFHGKTLGALSASMRPHYQDAFFAPVEGFLAVPFGDAAALEAVLLRHRGEIAAFLVEPIQAEGGVFEPPAGYFRAVRTLCDAHDVALIVDEVQTGLGRTGRLFGIEAEGIKPDIMTLAKALGGGLIPMAAVLARGSVYNIDFALKHTSTFAANTIGCRVGLAVLDMLERDDGALVRSVHQNGLRLRAGLDALAVQTGGVVNAVRGRGYLLGLEFSEDLADFPQQGLVGSLAAQGSLVLALTSWLLNVEGVRAMPTVFENRVLRIEPALIAGPAECDRFLAALGRGIEIIAAADGAALTGHLAGRASTQISRCRASKSPPKPAAGERRWGFVAHPLDFAGYRDMDGSLSGLTDGELKEIVRRLNASRFVGASRSLVVGAMRVRSPTGASAFGELIALSRTAQELLDMPLAEASSIVREAVELAHERGAEIVGLGGFTSIVTRNALDLTGVGVPLTTGNGYTAVNSAQSVMAALQAVGLEIGSVSVAIIGAAGAVGRACALLLAPKVRRLILVGNPNGGEASLQRLNEIAANLRAAAGNEGACARIDASIDLTRSLAEADIAVTATSHTGVLVTEDLVRSGMIVCDTARPSNIAPGLIERDDVLAIDGGLVRIETESARPLRYGLQDGVTYACMAETFLLALEGTLEAGSLGVDLPVAHLHRLEQAAARHGFAMAPLQVANRLLASEDISRVRTAVANRATDVRQNSSGSTEAAAAAMT